MKPVDEKIYGFKALAAFLERSAARAAKERDVFKGDSISLYFDGKYEAFKLAAKWVREEITNYEKGGKSIWP